MAVTSQQIIDFLLANPGMSDAEIVAAMEQYGVSPAQMAQAVGIPEGQVAARVAVTVPPGSSITLGDTIVQPNYSVIGSGEDQQIGGLENVYTYKVGANQVGGAYNQYTATGELARTGTQQEVNANKDFLAAALGAAGLFGGAALAGLGGAATTVGTTGLTAAQLAALDLALGGAGGTAGATSLATALTTGAEVGTLANLTGGSGVTTGAAGGITAQSVADKLAADAAAQAKITADAAATKAAADAAAAKAAGDTAAAKAAAEAAAKKAVADAAAAKAAADAATAKAAADAAATKAAADAAAAAKLTGDAAAAKVAADAAAASAAAKAASDAAAAKLLAANAAAAAAAKAVTTGVTTGLTTAAAKGLISGSTTSGLTASQLGSLLSSGLTTGAGLLQQGTSKEAALAAQQRIDAETAAAKQAAAFRPVGMTTRFGTSQFTVDPVTGQLTSAGYTLDPQAKNAQDRLVKLAEQGLQQAEGAQAQYAPLQTGAQSLFGLGQGILNAPADTRLGDIASQYLAQSPESKSLTALGTNYLTQAPEVKQLTALGSSYLTQSPESKMLTALGSQYIAQSPEQVAQNYLNQQMALLQPGRELELANLQNKLQQQGRAGLSVAQGGSYGATTPELQALYNARAMQEAQLAANAQQAGQQQVQFGAGLVGTGQQLGIQGQQFGANLIGTGQQLGIQGQQFGSNLLSAGQQLGIQGQQFGMNALANQQALEQQRLGFGSGLLSQGAGLQGQYYAGQQAAYAPYTTALGQVQNLETLAQQPLTMGASLGQTAAQAGFNVGQLGLKGAGASVDLATGQAATTNPYATALSGLGSSSAFGQAAGGLLGGLFGSAPAVSGFSYGQYGTGIDPSTGEYFGSLYF